MKRLLVLLLVLTMALLVFTSCEYLPPAVKDAVDSLVSKIPRMGDDVTDEPGDEHEHDFTLTETKDPTCVKKGIKTYTCSCGETQQEEFGDFADHSLYVRKTATPTCTKAGETEYRCLNCSSYKEIEELPATGHSMAATIEVSRLVPCENDNCSYAVFPEGEGKYKEIIVYKFTEEDLSRFDSVYAELEAIISAADAYDSTLHGYAEGTPLHESYLAMEAKYEELYDVLEYVVTQCQIAETIYNVDTKNKQKEETYNYISEVRTDLVSRFYNFSEPLYDSMYREFYYYGMKEQEIMAFIFDSNAVSNPEYKALVDRNTEIELAFKALAAPETDPQVPELYAEFVSNNKKIASLMGYDNYLEYAYENVYSRDYSYTDVAEIVGYVKEHLGKSYCVFYDSYIRLAGSGNYTEEDVDAYYTQVSDSFFLSYDANKLVNDYIDLMAFTSNPDKQISFSDELNGLVGNGNLFRGSYEGAYVTYLMELEIPIAYFGSGYDNPFTIVHEFGHYMNEIYNGDNDDLSQSFDLLETHSQGDELLYLAFLKDKMPETGFKLCEKYQLLVMLDTVMAALAVDTFEQAVYTDTYSGTYSEEIMADGKITADEYDLLYQSILADFGTSDYQMTEYWRYVTINAPCYYVSYAVSALSALQLYEVVDTDGFDAARESYLKLFTYTDDSIDMTTEEVLEYAGLLGFTEEELYSDLGEMYAKKSK